MNPIIVYIDDAAHALQTLQPLLCVTADDAAQGERDTHWILVGCAPRVTRRVSKWVTHSARDNWRRKWADKVFASLVPELRWRACQITTLLADDDLSAQTDTLLAQHGAARVVDARRPKVDHSYPAALPLKIAMGGRSLVSFVTTLAGVGLLATLD